MKKNKREFLLSSFLIFALNQANATRGIEEFPSSEIRSIRIKSDQGKIAISPTENGEPVKVDYYRLNAYPDSNFSINLNNYVLDISNLRPGAGGSISNFEVKLPNTANIDIETGNTEISIKGIKGNASLKTGEAIINIDSPLQSLEIKAGSAKINVKDIQGNIFLNLGSGDANLTYEKIINNPPNIKIDAGKGNFNIFLPNNSRVQYFASFMKKVTSAFYNTMGMPVDFYINFSSGSGNLNIRKSNL